MRIIAGKHRSRAISPPKGKDVTRPITDRSKENLFNRLQSLGVLEAGQLHGVVDVFCGTGSLGLEALSRGADFCTFVDHDTDALARLRKNLQTLDENANAQVIQIGALVPVWLTPLGPETITLAFIDPPYAMVDDPASRQGVFDLLQMIVPKLEPGGLSILRTRRHTPIPEHPLYDGPITSHEGNAAIHLFQKPLD